MNGEIFETCAWTRGTVASLPASAAVEAAQQTGAGKETAFLFDDLSCQAGSGKSEFTWRAQVLTVPLRVPTRRRIRFDLRGALDLAGFGSARVSLVCEDRILRVSSTSPHGDTRSRNFYEFLVLRKSAEPRTQLCLQLLLEAHVKEPQHQSLVTVDSMEILVL